MSIMHPDQKTKRVQEFYDDLIYGKSTSFSKGLEMLRAFPVPCEESLPQLDVLEVGLGRGEWTAALAQLARRYVGVDISEATLRYVRDNVLTSCHPGKCELVHADVLQLPLSDESVDIAFCIGALHHTPNPRHGFGELFRTLRPGGTLNIMLYGRVLPRNVFRELGYWISRLGVRGESAVLRTARWLERFELPDAMFFNASGEMNLYRDWYFAPIQSHHTLHEITGWAKEVGGFVSYVFLDPYRSTLKRHTAWARGRMTRRWLCPDFMASISKKSASRKL